MFGDMFNVLMWGVAVSVFAILFATFAEGRGSHALKAFMEWRDRKSGLDLYETLEREDDWRVLSTLAEVDTFEVQHPEVAAAQDAAVPVSLRASIVEVAAPIANALRTAAPIANALRSAAPHAGPARVPTPHGREVPSRTLAPSAVGGGQPAAPAARVLRVPERSTPR